eukprot:COSAG05_NODE_6774_length_905_cov_1.258065_1_plen_49_part_10
MVRAAAIWRSARRWASATAASVRCLSLIDFRPLYLSVSLSLSRLSASLF